MPWKGEKDPYKIWLSEVILQQTRVEQGRAYYEKFIDQFPTIQDLAKAKDEKVFKLWEGLGYYNRCRNLLHTARQITKDQKGVFPNTYDSLLSLKGVGPYTAAAIASFAFNLPYAVVDGNVFRVLSRFYGIATPIDTKEGLQIFNELADKNLAEKTPGTYNQAIMDFGATVCKPSTPDCSTCNLSAKCVAFNVNKVNQLPVKLKRITKKKRHFDFFCFNYNGQWMDLFSDAEKNQILDWVFNGSYQTASKVNYKVSPTGSIEVTFQNGFGIETESMKFDNVDSFRQFLADNAKLKLNGAPINIKKVKIGQGEGSFDFYAPMDISNA